MRLNSKMTWGLGWAGLAIVLAVPSADFLTGKLGDGKAAVLTSTTEAVKTASVTTTITPSGIKITPTGSLAPAQADPVDSYLKTRKALPSYITDETATATPATSGPTAASSVEPVKVATLAPEQAIVAPTPFPSWARPHDVASKPAASQVAKVSPLPAATPAPVIVDENALANEQQPDVPPQVATAAPAGPIPPAPIVDDSENWQNGKLKKYLSDEGLLDEGQSTANVTVQDNSDYDADGFYLSDGPNSDRAAALRAARRRARLERLLDEDESDYYAF